MFLLDTHVWVWSVENDEDQLGPQTRRMIARAGAHGLLRVSPVSLFEIAALHKSGRLQFWRSLEQWIRDAVEHVRIADVTVDAAVDAGQIPRTALSDPMDRLLVATARYLDATLVTADRAILKYADSGNVRTQNAGR